MRGLLCSALCGRAEQPCSLGRGWRLLRWLSLFTFFVTSFADAVFHRVTVVMARLQCASDFLQSASRRSGGAPQANEVAEWRPGRSFRALRIWQLLATVAFERISHFFQVLADFDFLVGVFLGRGPAHRCRAGGACPQGHGPD